MSDQKKPVTIEVPISECCDRCSPHFALGSVQVVPCDESHVYCVATDSRSLAIVQQDGSAESRFLIPSLLLANVKFGREFAEVKQDDGKVTATRFRNHLKQYPSTVMAPPDGAFPKVANVIPEKFTRGVSMDIEVLMRLAKAVDENARVTLLFQDDDALAIGVIGNNGIGAIMPMHATDDPEHKLAIERYHEKAGEFRAAYERSNP